MGTTTPRAARPAGALAVAALALATVAAGCSTGAGTSGPTSAATGPTTSAPPATTGPATTARQPATSAPGRGTVPVPDGAVDGHSQREELTRAATGTWAGRFGTLTFASPTTARFTWRNCGTDLAADDPLAVSDSCSPNDTSGVLTVRDHGYGLGAGSGGADLFDAYLDGAGRLHLGLGDVAEIRADGSADIEPFASGTTITVDDRGCSAKATGEARREVPCAWVERDGVTLLRAEVPEDSPIDGTTTRTRWWVWEPEVGLLVSPSVYVGVFERT